MATEFLKMAEDKFSLLGNLYSADFFISFWTHKNLIPPIRILQIISEISDWHYEWLCLTSATAASTLGNNSGNSGSDDISGGLNGTAFPSPPTLKTGVPQGFMDLFRSGLRLPSASFPKSNELFKNSNGIPIDFLKNSKCIKLLIFVVILQEFCCHLLAHKKYQTHRIQLWIFCFPFTSNFENWCSSRFHGPYLRICSLINSSLHYENKLTKNIRPTDI